MAAHFTFSTKVCRADIGLLDDACASDAIRYGSPRGSRAIFLGEISPFSREVASVLPKYARLRQQEGFPVAFSAIFPEWASALFELARLRLEPRALHVELGHLSFATRVHLCFRYFAEGGSTRTPIYRCSRVPCWARPLAPSEAGQCLATRGSVTMTVTATAATTTELKHDYRPLQRAAARSIPSGLAIGRAQRNGRPTVPHPGGQRGTVRGRTDRHEPPGSPRPHLPHGDSPQ